MSLDHLGFFIALICVESQVTWCPLTELTLAWKMWIDHVNDRYWKMSTGQQQFPKNSSITPACLAHRTGVAAAGGRVSSTLWGQIRSITRSIDRQRAETTPRCLSISWIYSLLIRVTATFHQCHLPPDQWGVKKEELTGLNVLQCLSCIITHLSK